MHFICFQHLTIVHNVEQHTEVTQAVASYSARAVDWKCRTAYGTRGTGTRIPSILTM